ncbi:MAG: MBL fold metallo-hydrolase [Marinifilaceae bacterium]|jgi:phosphoribosyl 1,2-cyclic phosphate phosphodiesterase|nr:MBL fold metallo-hydrolase [Marinifilaceae bacterium]
MLKLCFLGTGTSQGVPVIACDCDICRSNNSKDKRLRSSVFIESEQTKIVIDSGPDFRYQMLREDISDISAIIFTHEHKDHVAGLDDIRAFNWRSKKPMQIFAEARVQDALKKEFSYIFAENKYPGVPEVEMNLIEDNSFQINDLTITPIRVMHYKLPVYGYRINDLVYITDANYIPEEEMYKLEGAKVLIINALRKESHISHFTLDQALKLIEIVKPERAYLTHISHQMGRQTDIEKILPENVYAAFDGLCIKI